MAFSYSTVFTLDKAYFIECYEQTALKPKGVAAYKKAIFLLILGVVSWFIAPQYQVLAYFMMALSGIEVCSVIFAKTWWLWRQLLSKAANEQAELTIDEEGVKTHCAHINSTLLWRDINNIESTSAGFILHHDHGRNYLSAKQLNDNVIAFINQQPTIKN